MLDFRGVNNSQTQPSLLKGNDWLWGQFVGDPVSKEINPFFGKKNNHNVQISRPESLQKICNVPCDSLIENDSFCEQKLQLLRLGSLMMGILGYVNSYYKVEDHPYHRKTVGV